MDFEKSAWCVGLESSQTWPQVAPSSFVITMTCCIYALVSVFELFVSNVLNILL